MIVKFLSFVATVIGTARYKTILLSCIALVISLTGVTAIALTKSGSTTKDASATVKQVENKNNQDSSLDGRSFRSLNTKETPADASQQPTAEPDAISTQTKPTETAKPADTTEAPAVDIVLSNSSVTVSSSNPATMTANVSDNSSVAWAVDPGDHDGVHVTIQDSTNGLSFQVTADDNATAGRHILTVTAKDASRKIEVTKQITVIIT